MHVVHTRLYISSMYHMCDYLNNYLKVSFLFFSSPYFFLLMFPSSSQHCSQLRSLDLSLHHKKKNLSLYHDKPHISPSLSLSLSLAIHLRQPLVLRRHRHHHPQEPYLTPFEVYSPSPSINLLFFLANLWVF